jgi:glycerol transport system ATP-binding protein
MRAVGSLATLGDGAYTLGFRPNHVEIVPRNVPGMTFHATLTVFEITGSETFVHLDHHGERWVGLVHGVRDLRIGEELEVHLDPSHVYVFDAAGRIVAPASYAIAA